MEYELIIKHLVKFNLFRISVLPGILLYPSRIYNKAKKNTRNIKEVELSNVKNLTNYPLVVKISKFEMLNHFLIMEFKSIHPIGSERERD